VIPNLLAKLDEGYDLVSGWKRNRRDPLSRRIPAARSSNPLQEAKAHALSLVPAGVPVSATNEFGGDLSDRSLVYTFPHIGRARWAIVDSGDPAHAAQGVEVLRKPLNP
jgi:hypothetical protein